MIEKKQWKTIVTALLLGTMVLSSGCAGKKEPEAEPVETAAPERAIPQQEPEAAQDPLSHLSLKPAEKLTTKADCDNAGNTIRETYIDASGNPCISANGAAMREYEYDAKNRCIRVINYDAEGNICGDRNRVETAQLVYTGNDLTQISFRDSKGKLMLVEGLAAGVRFSYEEGRPVRAELFGMDEELCEGSAGYAILEARYYTSGRLMRLVCRNREENPVESSGRLPEAVTELWNGFPTPEPGAEMPFAEQVIRYPDTEHLKMELYGAQGKTYALEKIIQKEYQKDLVTRWLEYASEEAYKAEEPLVERVMEYDGRGMLASVQYRDSNGAPIQGSEGWASVRYEYNAEGLLLQESRFDVQGNSQMLAGYCAVRYEYDENGFVSAEVRLNENGKPSDRANTGARIEYVRDSSGNILMESHRSSSGAAVSVNGYSNVIREYDACGNVTGESYYGTDGRAVTLDYLGYSVRRSVYSKQGRVIQEAFYNEKGQPALRHGEYSSASYDYDIFGNCVRYAYYTPDGSLAMPIHEFEFDSLGHSLVEQYCGSDGTLVRYGDYARYTEEWDYERNRVLKTAYYDEYGNYAYNNTYGNAYMIYTYNDQAGTYVGTAYSTYGTYLWRTTGKIS